MKQKLKKIWKKQKIKITSMSFLIFISNPVFYSIIKIGQNNSKLYMQYDFQKALSIEMVTYYITIIVFLSRIARIIGNIKNSYFIKKKSNLKVRLIYKWGDNKSYSKLLIVKVDKQLITKIIIT